MQPRQPDSSPFPYTTLFRSNRLPGYAGRDRMPGVHGIRIHYPGHGLLVGAHVGRQDIELGSETIQHLRRVPRSEEHTSELQSRRDLVCRLLLEKKKVLKNSM